ncbi:MAG: nucleotidyltransferase domain-containing protein [Lachnospiraceae bacterium]|nr:nucleotidyltransferase domain-containing protein [Lachnospiraceae bacterium]
MAVMNIDKVNGIKRDQVSSCIEIVKTLPRIKRMIIFGSSVTDYCRKDSDIDICLDIEGSTKGMDLFEVSSNISKACDYNCDMLTYGKLHGKIKEEIDTKGVVVYELS